MANDSAILSGSEDGSVYCWDLIEVSDPTEEYLV